MSVLADVLAKATTWQVAEAALMLLAKVAAAWTASSFDSDYDDDDDGGCGATPGLGAGGGA